MASFTNDQFVGTNGDSLDGRTTDTGSGTWTFHPTLGNSLNGKIQNNRAYGGSSNCYWYVAGEVAQSANYTVTAELVYTGFGGINLAGVAGRLASGAETMYTLQRDTNSIDLYKFVAGAVTLLGSVSISYANCTITLGMLGTSITATVVETASGEYVKSDGTTQVAQTTCISVTDSSVTAIGFAGMQLNNAGFTTRIHLENFDASEAAILNETASNTMALVQAHTCKAFRRPLYLKSGRRIGKLPDGEFVGGLPPSEFLVVTFTDMADPTYYYYGGLDETAAWQINRYLKTDVTSKSVATIATNGAYGDLSSAWTARTSLVYG